MSVASDVFSRFEGPAKNWTDTQGFEVVGRNHASSGALGLLTDVECRASDVLGNRAQASEYFGKLVNLAKNADTERLEVREAKAFLAR